MIKKILIVLSILTLGLLSVCSIRQIASDNTITATIEDSTGQNSQIQTELAEATDMTDQSQSVSFALSLKTHEDESDYTWDSSEEHLITLNGSAIQSDGVGVNITKNTATIITPGTYHLKGNLEDGQLLVNTKNEGVIRLILDNASLNNSSGPAIYIKNADKVVIILPDGSQNTLSDSPNYVLSSTDEDQPNATLFSKDDLTINGSGTLTVRGNYEDAIATKDGLIIRETSITVIAADDGIRGKNYVKLQDSTLNFTTGGDGLKSDSDNAEEPGSIMISSSNLTVHSVGDAISARGQVQINSGTFLIQTNSGSYNWNENSSSAKGIKGSVSVQITDGNFSIDSADDAIHSNGSITINGGTYTIASGDDGLHSDNSLTINGGTVDVTTSYEGLESALITINGGTVHITSGDDGINGSAGKDASGTHEVGPEPAVGQQPGGGTLPPKSFRPGGNGLGNQFAQTGSSWLYITGGYLYVNAAGDGLDINGSAEISGGTVLVDGPTENMNGSLDFLGTFNITGGLLIAVGSAGMAQAPSETSTQPSIVIFFDSTQTTHSLINLRSVNGEQVIAYAPAKDYQAVVLSSPDLLTGSDYTLFLGGFSSGEATDGLYSGGDTHEGSLYTTISLTSTVTTIGTSRGMGGFGGPGKRP